MHVCLPRRRLAVIGIAALVAPVATLAPQLTASAASSGPGVWVQLSSGSGIGNIANPDVTRFGSALQVVWTQQSGSNEVLHTRILASNGSAASGDIAVVSGWATLNEFPSIIPNGSQRVIVFAGQRSVAASDPYSQGAMYYATSSDGLTWTLSTGSLSSSKQATTSYGTDAADAAGTPVVAFIPTSQDYVSYHIGFDSNNPSTTPDSATSNTGPFAYYAGIGYDAKAGQAWTAWYSNSGKSGTDGIDAQRIYPSLGSLLHAPRSTVVSGSSGSSVDAGQRVQVAARVGGGLFTAYKVGYPSPKRVAFWRLGASTALLISTPSDVGAIGVAPGPGGRMWIFWRQMYGSTMHAVRTNKAATRVGKVCTFRSPHGSSDVWKTAGNGSNGRLDLVASATVNGNIQMYSTQVLPCLSGAVSPTSIRSSSGGTITVYVRDAGAPVAGAAVRYAGVTKKTGALGKVTFSVARGTTKGKKTVTFKHSGYTGGAVRFRVT